MKILGFLLELQSQAYSKYLYQINCYWKNTTLQEELNTPYPACNPEFLKCN